MAITIRHLDGPLKGQVQHFDDSVETIVFGREPESCQVLYPPDYALVGKRHFALNRTMSGHYEVELFGRRFVEIDGVQADNGMPVRSESLIRLGHRDGPSFSVEIQKIRKGPVATSSQPGSGTGWFSGWGSAAETDEEQEPSPIVEAEALPRAAKPAAAPPEESLAANEEAATALERAIASLRAGQVPTSTSPSEEQFSPKADELPGVDALLATRRRANPIARGLALGGGDVLGSLAHLPPISLGQHSTHAHAPTSSPYSYPEAAQARPSRAARRRSLAGLWWLIAAAAGLGALAYFIFRRDTMFGEALGTLLPASMPPPGAPSNKDLVEASIFGPQAVEAGGECLVQVLLHKLDQRELAKALAKEADPDASRRGVQTLSASIARWQHVQILVEGRGLVVFDEMQTLVWSGEPCACQFTVAAPENLAGRTVHPRALVLIEGVPIGSLTFTLKVTAEKPADVPPKIKGDTARRYDYAFLSYASADRPEVIKRAQGLKAGGTRFFNDLLSLEPGDRWEQKLYEEIDRCDVFYLFWSSQAKTSEWVMRETEYALARRAASTDGAPDIIPVIIEGPPPPSAPESLRDIHFNDHMLYILAGVQAQ